MGYGINRLTALQVKNQKKSGYHADGAGLHLCVKSTGGKSWIFRYRFGGKEREMGLGSLDTFSLLEARERALEQRKLIAQGKDPIDHKRALEAQRKQAADSTLTFDEAAAQYIASQRAGWKSEKHAEQWTNTLKTYASPVLGNLPVSQIDAPAVLRVLSPIWTTKTETASRLRGRIEKILGWAQSKGFRSGDNPAAWAGHLEFSLSDPSKTKDVQHHPALPWREMSAFMQALQAMPGGAAAALTFIVLTACRTSEAIEATWAEFDLQNKLWTIPKERMKSSKEHVIPLSDEALDLLQKSRDVNPDSTFVFPGGKHGKPLSNMSCLAVLKRMKRSDLTTHGFRSSFRDWAGESTAHPREVIEHALAHQLKDKAEAAYSRGTLLQKRAALMQDWAAHCKNQNLTLSSDGLTQTVLTDITDKESAAL